MHRPIIGSARGSSKAWQEIGNGLSCLGESRQAFKSGLKRMRMKKKKSANASGAAKRRKTGAAARQGAPRRTQQAAAARPAAPNDSRPTIRRLRSELAKALARVEELKACADTDFL